jgi:hypothetical protein
MACRAHCYRQMGRQEDAIEDIQKIRMLIKENTESQKLLNRYGHQIRPLLKYYGPIND